MGSLAAPPRWGSSRWAVAHYSLALSGRRHERRVPTGKKVTVDPQASCVGQAATVGGLVTALYRADS